MSEHYENLLEIVVEGMNHKNSNDVKHDRKGMYGSIWYEDQNLVIWNETRFPLSRISQGDVADSDQFSDRHFGIFTGEFELDRTDDTFLDF